MDSETEKFLAEFDKSIKDLGKSLDLLEKKMDELEKKIEGDLQCQHSKTHSPIENSN
jgi:prefoldin subunit 5